VCLALIVQGNVEVGVLGCPNWSSKLWPSSEDPNCKGFSSIRMYLDVMDSYKKIPGYPAQYNDLILS
jgi:hypothetical protein